MPRSLSVPQFLPTRGVLLDVRSPGEYDHARIPGAVSFPRFSNEERTARGTCYKQRGRDQAVAMTQRLNDAQSLQSTAQQTAGVVG